MIQDTLELEKTYAGYVGSRLEKHSLISYTPYKALFRCPICGDSEKNKHKRRGYFLERSGHILFYCHNGCGGMGLVNFVKNYHLDLFNDYRMDLIRGKEYLREVEVKPEEPTVTIDIDLVSAWDVPQAAKYLTNRKINHKDIFYTSNYYSYINSIVPNKFPSHLVDHERIVFPLRRVDSSVYGVVGRSISPEFEPKYLTIKFDENHPKLFGLERYNPMLSGLVVEGPIDSLFLDNCIAILGTDSDLSGISGDFTVVLDNQPRSEQILRKYEKYISNNHKMVIWPISLEEKDINDMILSGMSSEEVMKIIKDNTYSGLRAKIELNKWRKI